MKILLTADIHLLLHKKGVPYDWQKNRFEEFFDKLLKLEASHDVTIIAGDVFDKKPTEDEVTLIFKLFNRFTKPCYIIPGNHEATKKGSTFLDSFAEEHVISNPNIHIITKNTRLEILGQGFMFYPYGEMQIDNLPSFYKDDVLVTHIRGEIPPHITAEYDFEKIKDYKLIMLGDIHAYMRYKHYNAYYPGSPMNVTFDRDEYRDYGIISIDFNSIDDYTIQFIDLDLPKLIRRTAVVGQDLVKHDRHHVVYEVKGSIDELSKMKNHELLDKKISYKPKEASKLDLSNLSIVEELDKYLLHIQITNSQQVLEEYKSL